MIDESKVKKNLFMKPEIPSSEVPENSQYNLSSNNGSHKKDGYEEVGNLNQDIENIS